MRLCRGQARETCPSRKYWMLALALSTAGGRLWQALQTALAHHKCSSTTVEASTVAGIMPMHYRLALVGLQGSL